MSIAALSPGGPHVVCKLAFATPVREAGGAPHWVTLHAEGSDEGTCHILIGGNGAIQAGPKGLLGHHIAALASHPSVSRAQHHPVGHEPPGARDHPHYAEASPNAERPTPNAGPEAAKRPGKPYARLSGAEQGTRAEQIGKALSEAQGAAKGAKAAQGQQPASGTYRALGSEAWSPETHAEVQGTQLTDAHRTFFREHPHILDAIRQSTSEGAFATKAPSLASSSSRRTRLTPEENARRFKDYQDVKALGFLHHERGIEPRIRGSLWTHGQKFLQEQHEAGKGAGQPEGARRATGFDNPVSATARMADKSAEAAERSGGRLTDMGAQKEQLRAKVEAARAAKAARQQHADVADTAVAHQQAQADLAAHRAKADRNPNPWAPHLSPPVGDAKDRELAEKATRAQMAHQAAQAQQQGAQQAEQQEGQRAHEKEMVRLKQATGAGRQASEAPSSSKPRPAHEHQEGDSGDIYKARNELAEAQHRWTRAKVEARTPAEHKRVELHQEMVRRLTNQVRDLEGKAKPADAPKPAEPKKPAQAAYEALQAEVKRRQGDRPAQQTPRFSEPQTAPQPEQSAGAPHEDLPPVSRAIADSVARGIKRVDKDNVEQIGRAHSDKQIEGTVNALKQRYPAATVNHDEVAQRIHAATPTYRVNSGHAGRLAELRALKERIAKTHRVKGEEDHPLVKPAFKALDERIAQHAKQYEATAGQAKKEAGSAAEIMMAHQSAARASHMAASGATEQAQPQPPVDHERRAVQEKHEARVAEHRRRVALESQIIDHAQHQQHHSRQGPEPNHSMSIAHGSKKDQLLRDYRRQFGNDAYEGVLDRVEAAQGRKKVRESAAPTRFTAPAAR